MSTKRALFALLVVLSMGTLIHAQSKGTIVFVTYDWVNKIDPETNESPDMPHIYALEDAGYEVIPFYNGSLSTASQATLDTLYNADLIVMGRSTPSLGYGDHKQAWNDITTPTLCLEMWAIRNNRLNWLNTTNISSPTEEGTIYNAIIEQPDDPVFEGFDTSVPMPWVISPMDYMSYADAGNGTVLARLESDSSLLFVRFEPDVEFYDGSVDAPGGYRSLFGNGRDNGGAAPFDYYNFTGETEEIYIAEVARLIALGGGTAVEDREHTTTPSTFVLSQNYPNPFNPTTRIDYMLPKNAHVTLTVYDALGHQVNTLVNQYQTAAQYSYEFDAHDLASGIYFYELKVDNQFVATKKMVIMK
jgi:hypothetical protein